MTLKQGIGSSISVFPARSPRCLYSGTFFAAAPACQQNISQPCIQQPKAETVLQPQLHTPLILLTVATLSGACGSFNDPKMLNTLPMPVKWHIMTTNTVTVAFYR